MKRFLAPVLLLSLLIGLLSACTNTSKIIAAGLKGELTGIICASDGSVTATWHVVNPNIVPYLFSRVSSKIYLNGTYVGAIVDENPLGIPANSEANRSGKIKVDDGTARNVIAAALAQGSASYRVDTQITILVYDDTVEKSTLTNSGTVPVTAK